MTKLGLVALGCYAVHAAFHLYHRRPEDLLWACHLGTAMVGFGLILRCPELNGIGVMFLCMGTPLGLFELTRHEQFLPTSTLTHLGGLSIGLFGIRRLGLPQGTWWKASA